MLYLGIFQVLVSNLLDGVVPVMWHKMAQWMIGCQSVCLEFNCIVTVWFIAVLTCLMPCIDACVWVLDNHKRCTHHSVIKYDWEALSNNALHARYCPDLFWRSTISFASRMRFLALHLNEHYVSTSEVGLPLAFACEALVAVPFLLVDSFCLLICSKLLCLLWHWRQTCFVHVWLLVNGWKQLKQIPDCLAWLRRCLACILINLSHLNSLCDPLHK